MPEDEIKFHGHPNVLSLHSRTVEITRSENLSLRGDCIIGVGATKACSDLSESVKKGLRQDGSLIKMEVLVGNESFRINGIGDSRLSLLDKHDIVIRKTRFVCPRTMSVGCDKASSDLPRSIVGILQDRASTGIFRVSVE